MSMDRPSLTQSLQPSIACAILRVSVQCLAVSEGQSLLTDCHDITTHS